MGCCVHHHHHLHTNVCHASQCEPSSENSDSHDSSCEVKEVAAESCAHSCCHEGSGSKNPGSDADVFVSAEHDSPCDGNHDCEEPSCSFVVSTPQTSVAIKAVSTWVIYISMELTARDFLATVHSFKGTCLGLSSPPLSSQSACALLQSWQI